MIATFTVENSSGVPIPEGTTVDANSIPFDHSALVEGLMSRADGFDLILRDEIGGTVPICSIANLNATNCRIIFNLTNSGLGVGQLKTYTLEHGDLGKQIDQTGATPAGSANVACVVTFEDPVLPDPSFPMGDVLGRGSDESPYPSTLSPRVNYRNNTPYTAYSLEWANISALEWYEIRAFVHAQRGGAFDFTSAAASFLPAGTYVMRPGSARFNQSSRTGFAASLEVEGALN